MHAGQSQDQESIVRDIVRKTRRKFSSGEKMKIDFERLKNEWRQNGCAQIVTVFVAMRHRTHRQILVRDLQPNGKWIRKSLLELFEEQYL